MSAHTAMVRQRRTIRMVATLIMGGAIRPRPVFVKMVEAGSSELNRRHSGAPTELGFSRVRQYCCPSRQQPTWMREPGISRFRVRRGACHRAGQRPDPLASPRNDESNRRIPRRRNHPVTAAVLFDIAEARERIVEALHLQF